MDASDKAFTGSIPQIYDRLLVPMIFEPYALDLAQRIKQHAVHDLLETAAGTGVLTRALASHLPDTARIAATDLNEPMLAQARTRLAAITRSLATGGRARTPLRRRRFDTVVCQFGVMFFPDRSRLPEARRVLKPGGRFFFNVWDKITENDFRIHRHEASSASSRMIRRDSWRALHTGITTLTRSGTT